MCCCGQPVINGQPGYKWQPGDTPGVRPVSPPALGENDSLVYDEPGRCGGLDAHSHHYRLVMWHGRPYLLVRHGGGEERIRLSGAGALLDVLAGLETHQRYWLLHTIYYAHNDGERDARDKTAHEWRKAAAEKRIKTRKVRGADQVKVWIEG